MGFAAIGGSPNCYEATLNTGMYVDAVVNAYDTTANWYAGTNGTLIPNCDLLWVANRATVLTTAYSWFYNSGTGLLTINTGGGAASPEIVRGDNRATPYTAGAGANPYSGLTLSGCSNLTLTGTLTLQNINKYSNSDGYGVIFTNPTNINAGGLRIVAHGCGYHG